jgi:hypothetical protein
MTVLHKRHTAAQSAVGDPPLNIWHCNTQPVIPKMMPTKKSKKLGISVYGRPPMIDDMYNKIMATKVVNVAVERDPP